MGRIYKTQSTTHVFNLTSGQSRSQSPLAFWSAPRHGALESIFRDQDFRTSGFTAKRKQNLMSISSPELTCLWVSTKTRSSGIINKLVPKALVSSALLSFQSQVSTFLVFPVRIEYLCGTHPHRLYLWTPCKPKHACAVKLEVLKSWSLKIDYSRAPCLGADQKARGFWERD